MATRAATECEYFDNYRCKLSSSLATKYGHRLPIVTTDKACDYCLGLSCPKTVNHVVASLVYSQVARDAEQPNGKSHPQAADNVRRQKLRRVHGDVGHLFKLGVNCETDEVTPEDGAGNILHAILLERFGVNYSETCQCRELQNLMNRLGPKWCEEFADWIADRMVEEASRRGWYLLVFLAPNVAKTKAVELVLEACTAERARKERVNHEPVSNGDATERGVA